MMMDLAGRITGLQTGQPRTLAGDGRPWTTGFFKQPVSGGTPLSRTGLAGDGQADLRNHGGPDKAVNLYPREHYAFWAAEFDIEPMVPAAFGENFTTEGLLEAQVCIGDVFRVGNAQLQVSQPRQPCWKLGRRWARPKLPARVQETGRTGWYCRVLVEGTVTVGDALVLVERHHPEWTVSAANRVMHHRPADFTAAAALAACPALSTSWRETLRARATTREVATSGKRLEG